MAFQKKYLFRETAPHIADVIVKVRLMQKLTAKEELIYLVFVKDIFKKEISND